MNIKQSLINFLYDKDYYITVYEDNIFVFNYLELLDISDNLVVLKLKLFELRILGNNLLVKRLTKEEILICGKIESIEFNYY